MRRGARPSPIAAAPLVMPAELRWMRRASGAFGSHVEEVNELGLCGEVNGIRSHYEDTYDEEDLFDGQRALPGVLACLEDLSDHAFLRTNAAFGCVLHEEK